MLDRRGEINLEDVTTTTDIDRMEINKKIELFEACCEAMNSPESKVKKEYRHIVSNMLKLVKKFKNDNDKLTSESVKNSNIIKPSSSRNNYGDYASCTKNKPVEHVVIVKREDNSEANIFEQTHKTLINIKKNVDVIKIKKTDNLVVINTRNETQQNLLIEELNKIQGIKSAKPKKKIPSILIKEIVRDKEIKNYEEYIKKQIHENLNIEINKSR